MNAKLLIARLAPRASRRRTALSLVRDVIRKPASLPSRLSRQNFKNYELANSLTIRCVICGATCTPHYDFPDVNLRHAHGIGVLRETLSCTSCKGTMRDRQMALGLLMIAERAGLGKIENLAKLTRSGFGDLKVLDTDSFGAINAVLRGAAGYTHSQYVPNLKNGEILADDSINLNLLEIPFEDSSIDIIMTSDVIEHIIDDERVHREIHRVLKPGGIYIFTAPFDPCLYGHRKLTQSTTLPELNFFLYYQVHGDPHSSNGIVAHRIYGQQIFSDLKKVGFEAEFFEITDLEAGIFGGDLFIAKKVTDKCVF